MKTLKERLAAAMEGPPRVRQVALARACGVDPSTVNDWLSGRTRVLQGENLLSAARFLGISPEWLATGRGPMHAEGESSVKATAGEGSASQSGRLDADTLRQAIRFTRTFLIQSGETPDLETHADYLAAAYEGLAETEAEGLDQIAFMGRMLAKLQGVERAIEREADRGSSQNTG